MMCERYCWLNLDPPDNAPQASRNAKTPTPDRRGWGLTRLALGTN